MSKSYLTVVRSLLAAISGGTSTLRAPDWTEFDNVGSGAVVVVDVDASELVDEVRNEKSGVFNELDGSAAEAGGGCWSAVVVGDTLLASATSLSSSMLRLKNPALSVDDVGRTVSGVKAVVDDLALSAGVIKSSSYSASTASMS